MIKLSGPWEDGYAFDMHTLYSIHTGYNEYGHPTFDTKRSPMGEYIYGLKYGQHIDILENIVYLLTHDRSFSRFIKNVDIIFPVPSSNKYRRIQPVLVCSQKLSIIYKKELREDVLKSTNKEELKNIPNTEKYDRIKDAIIVDDYIDKTKKILLFDDVYDSGATLSAMANALKEKGFKRIFVFTLTKTRKAD